MVNPTPPSLSHARAFSAMARCPGGAAPPPPVDERRISAETTDSAAADRLTRPASRPAEAGVAGGWACHRPKGGWPSTSRRRDSRIPRAHPRAPRRGDGRGAGPPIPPATRAGGNRRRVAPRITANPAAPPHRPAPATRRSCRRHPCLHGIGGHPVRESLNCGRRMATIALPSGPCRTGDVGWLCRTAGRRREGCHRGGGARENSGGTAAEGGAGAHERTGWRGDMKRPGPAGCRSRPGAESRVV